MGEMGTQISCMMRILVGRERESQRLYLMCATKRAEKSLVSWKTTKFEALKKSSFHSITYYIFNILFMSSSAARSSNLAALSGLVYKAIPSMNFCVWRAKGCMYRAFDVAVVM